MKRRVDFEVVLFFANHLASLELGGIVAQTGTNLEFFNALGRVLLEISQTIFEAFLFSACDVSYDKHCSQVFRV